jgi:ribonuclease HI
MKISEKHIKAIEGLVPKREQQAFLDLAIEAALRKERSEKTETIEVYVDGGSRGNPGPAGGGFAAYRGGELVLKGSEFYGEKTNNQAEYLALRTALRNVYEKFPTLAVQCFMDSQLVVEQMSGNYKVKSKNVQPLFEEVERISGQFKKFTIEHVERDQNALADKLANQAMNRGK